MIELSFVDSCIFCCFFDTRSGNVDARSDRVDRIPADDEEDEETD